MSYTPVNGRYKGVRGEIIASITHSLVVEHSYFVRIMKHSEFIN